MDGLTDDQMDNIYYNIEFINIVDLRTLIKIAAIVPDNAIPYIVS